MRQAVINHEYASKEKGGRLTKTSDASKSYNLRDLTAAWKNLTDGLQLGDEQHESVKVIIDV